MAEKQTRKKGYYEVDEALKCVLEEEEKQSLDDELDRRSNGMPDNVYKVERLVERRVRKVSCFVIGILLLIQLLHS